MALPRLVVVLSLVSLANDAASEMITPLLPLFLTGVLGAGAAVVGLVEGLAEAAASLLKYQAGRLADRGWSPRALVLGGYGLSSLARPAIGLAGAWGAVLALRFLDRAGKGIRTAPRDALIAASVPEATRGHAFGFHRAMDHAGSIVGPLLATALLAADAGLQQVFLLSVVPGALVMALLAFGLRAHEAPAVAVPAEPLRWRALDGRLRALVVAAGSLALAVAPEAFLVLWATANGVGLALVPLLWSAASVVKSAVAYLGGRWSDRVGRLPLLVAGWAARIAVLLALAVVPVSGGGTWLMFLLFAATLAVSEGPERALIGDVAPPGQRATAFGLYHLVYGLLALPGGLLFGALWQWAGSAVAFGAAAALTTAGVAALLLLARPARVRGGRGDDGPRRP
jgi:MFS family permease